jgi:hypothetical protein
MLLDQDLYNEDTDPKLVTQLVREHQLARDLIVDGLLGPKTAASIMGHRLGTRVMLKALSLAIADIGKGEEERNNESDWLRTVRVSDGTGKDGFARGPWCASWVSYCFVRAIMKLGAEGLIPWESSRGARALGRWLKANAWELEVPTPGAIGIYSRGPVGGWQGHAVIFESYYPDQDSAFTVEGNVGRFPAKVQAIKYSHGSWRKRLIGIYSL